MTETRRERPGSRLSAVLPGTWQLVSRVDVDASGRELQEPSLGRDPIAVLMYDRAGNFAAQFMKRDRSGAAPTVGAAGPNNTRAMGGYDAYFGSYSVDDEAGSVTQRLEGALTNENVGLVLTRRMTVSGDRLTIELRTASASGEAVTRTLTWRRIG
jgi:hypothetical protein